MKLRHSGLAVVLVSCVALAPLATASSAFAAPAKAAANDSRYFGSLPNHFGRLVLLDTADNSYVAIDGDLHGEREKTLDDAESEADFFDLPKAGQRSEISNLATGDLVKVDPSLPGGVGYQDGSIADPGYLFDVATDGAAKSDSSNEYLGFDDASGKLAMTATPRYKFVGSATGLQPVSLVAGVEKDTIDQAAGTAILAGTASSSLFDGVQIKIGSSWVATDETGRWLIQAAGLKAGQKNEVTVEQWVDGSKFDERTVEIDLGDSATTSPLEVTGPTENEKIVNANGRVDFSGTGADGSTVTAVTKSGVTLGSGKVMDGKWSFGTWRKIPGDYEVDLTMAGGDVTTPETKTVHYTLKLSDDASADLTIAGPTENETVVSPNGRVDFSGTAAGADGSTVTAVTKSGITLGSGKVANGSWAFGTWRKIPGAYEVTLTAAGGDLAAPVSKTVHYTLKLSDDVVKPFAVTKPADGSTITHPKGRVDFEGEGKPGSIVVATTKGGAELGRAQVTSTGTWVMPTWRTVAGGYQVTLTDGASDPIVVNYTLKVQ